MWRDSGMGRIDIRIHEVSLFSVCIYGREEEDQRTESWIIYRELKSMVVSYRPFAVHMMHICTIIWWRWWSEYSVLILAYLTTLLVYWRSVDLITLHPHNRRSTGYFSCLSVEQAKYLKGYCNSGTTDTDINNSMEQSSSSWTSSSELFKKFAAYYGTRRFSVVYTRASQLPPFWAR